MTYTKEYIEEIHRVTDGLDQGVIERMIQSLVELREKGGRLFFLGVGGGAGNATHAVNDFRTEAFQAVVWHLIVSHPAMKIHEMKWESVK